MKRILAHAVASVAYAFAVWVMTTRSDRWIIRRLRGLAWLLARLQKENAGAPVVLREAAQIFEGGPESSAIARRFILDARPEQFKALVRGAILD